MAFEAINRVSDAVIASADLTIDVIHGTGYIGKVYNEGMRDLYKAQLAASFDEQAAVDQSKWSDDQKARYLSA